MKKHHEQTQIPFRDVSFFVLSFSCFLEVWHQLKELRNQIGLVPKLEDFLTVDR